VDVAVELFDFVVCSDCCLMGLQPRSSRFLNLLLLSVLVCLVFHSIRLFLMPCLFHLLSFSDLDD
jgi:hypothetical protein